MSREEKYQLIDLLEKLRDEEIIELANDYGIEADKVRETLESDPEEIYEMDDGDCLLQGIDTVLGAIC